MLLKLRFHTHNHCTVLFVSAHSLIMGSVRLHIVSLIYFQHIISSFQSGQAEQSWVEPSTLSSPLCLFFSQVSLVGFLFLLGLYISSLASCMGGLYGAPRILQCIAQERVIPALGFLGKGVGAYREMIIILMCLYCGYFQNGKSKTVWFYAFVRSFYVDVDISKLKLT